MALYGTAVSKEYGEIWWSTEQVIKFVTQLDTSRLRIHITANDDKRDAFIGILVSLLVAGLLMRSHVQIIPMKVAVFFVLKVVEVVLMVLIVVPALMRMQCYSKCQHVCMFLAFQNWKTCLY